MDFRIAISGYDICNLDYHLCVRLDIFLQKISIQLTFISSAKTDSLEYKLCRVSTFVVEIHKG